MAKIRLLEGYVGNKMSFAKSSTSFLDLLPDIRDKIYHLVLVVKEAISSFTSTVFGSDLGLLERYLQLGPQILCVRRTIATGIACSMARIIRLCGSMQDWRQPVRPIHRGLKPEMLG